MQVERISQSRVTAAKTLPDLFQSVRDYLGEGHRRQVSISPRCLRRNEYTLSFTFKHGEGLFESETLRVPLDFAGKIFRRGIEKIVIRSGVTEADLASLVRLLENDSAKATLRTFSRPQIEISFIKIAPTPAAAAAPKTTPVPSAAVVPPASLTEVQADATKAITTPLQSKPAPASVPADSRPPIKKVIPVPERVGGITFGSLLENCLTELDLTSRFEREGNDRIPSQSIKDSLIILERYIKWLTHLAEGIEVMKKEYTKEYVADNRLLERRLERIKELLSSFKDRMALLEKILRDRGPAAPAQSAPAPAESRPPIASAPIPRPSAQNMPTFETFLRECQSVISLTDFADSGEIERSTTWVEDIHLPRLKGHAAWLKYLTQNDGITLNREFHTTRNLTPRIFELRNMLAIIERRIQILEKYVGGKFAPVKPAPSSAEPRPSIEEVAAATKGTDVVISRPGNNPFANLRLGIGYSRLTDLLGLCRLFENRMVVKDTFSRFFGSDNVATRLRELEVWLRYLVRDNGQTIADEYGEFSDVGDIKIFQGVLRVLEEWNKNSTPEPRPQRRNH